MKQWKLITNLEIPIKSNTQEQDLSKVNFHPPNFNPKMSLKITIYQQQHTQWNLTK